LLPTDLAGHVCHSSGKASRLTLAQSPGLHALPELALRGKAGARGHVCSRAQLCVRGDGKRGYRSDHHC
jgi:hypothetical protein